MQRSKSPSLSPDENALLTLHGPHATQSVRLTYVLMLATAAGTLSLPLALSAFSMIVEIDSITQSDSVLDLIIA
jgi:hypothetical protein